MADSVATTRSPQVIEESIGLLEDATFGLEVCASIGGVDGKGLVRTSDKIGEKKRWGS